MLAMWKTRWVVLAFVLIGVILVTLACGDEATPIPTVAPSTPTPQPSDATPLPATPTPVAPTPTAVVPTPTPTPTPSPSPTTEKPFEGETLKVTAFSGGWYDAVNEAIVTKFEEDTGATVELIPTYGEEVATILAAPADDPPYDVAAVFQPDFARGIAEDLWLELRTENLQHYQDISPFFAADHGMGLDISYGVPFDFFFIAMGYNKQTLEFTPTSWEDVWRPEAQGKIGLDSVFWFQVLSFTALTLDDAPGLGEVYSEEGLDTIIEKVQQLDVALWQSTGAEATAALERGDVEIVVAGPEVVAALAQRQPERFGVVIPQEGVAGSIDYFVVVRGTEKRDLGELFLDYLLDPSLQSAFAEKVQYWMSNSKTAYGPNALGILPPTEEERQEFGIMVNWDYLLENYTDIEDRLRREVFTQ